MNASRRKMMLWMMLSIAISIGWGYSIEHSNQDGLGDFRAVYYGARAVFHHFDPYREADFSEVYRREGGVYPTDPVRLRNFRRAVPVCVNLPSTLLIVAPVAYLSWGPAHLLWMILLPGGLLLASWLVLDLAGWQGSAFPAFLVCLLLANSEVLLELGNTSGMAASLCVIAAWCFFKERWAAAGVLCMAAGLALKPQEIGLIWLYFLLAGGTYRKRAVQSMGLAALIGLASILWVSHVAPHWGQEWHSNVVQTSAHGDLNDPGPMSIGNTRLGQMISMQSLVSFFRDDPRIYNPVSYLVCGIPILLWIIVTLRSRASRENGWLALASISALSLLPVYHREYDVKVILFAIPAAAMLSAGGRRWISMAIATAGFLFTADIPLAVLMLARKNLVLPQGHLSDTLASVVLERTPTLALMLLGMFYLWIYAQRAWGGRVQEQAAQDLAVVSA